MGLPGKRRVRVRHAALLARTLEVSPNAPALLNGDASRRTRIRRDEESDRVARVETTAGDPLGSPAKALQRVVRYSSV